jgi:hypothetical protein
MITVFRPRYTLLPRRLDLFSVPHGPRSQRHDSQDICLINPCALSVYNIISVSITIPFSGRQLSAPRAEPRCALDPCSCARPRSPRSPQRGASPQNMWLRRYFRRVRGNFVYARTAIRCVARDHMSRNPNSVSPSPTLNP